MENNSLSRRERKKLETRVNILRAARHLFEEKGFDNTSIEEITERADVSKGSFFNHFISKEILLAGIADEEVEDILYMYEQELCEIQSAEKKIRLIMKRLLKDAVPYLHLTGRVVFSSIINNSEGPSPFLKINDLIEELIKEGQHDGEIVKTVSPQDAASLIVGSYYGVIFKWFEHGCIPGKETELDSLLDIIFKSIRIGNGS